nr:hypothetical protein CPGR_01673 [Mycolicibacterium fortuitum subsp. fortuitum DSM 46621 = ATCC 6841 = JCM 6387]
MPEYRQHAGVVGGEPAQQALPPLVVIQHDQVGFGQVGAASVDDVRNPGAFLIGGESQWRAQALLDRRVAARSREHEGDGRQQAG